jgi:hypothetical protein
MPWMVDDPIMPSRPTMEVSAVAPCSVVARTEMMQERGKKANSISVDELWSSSPCSTAIVRMWGFSRARAEASSLLRR